MVVRITEAQNLAMLASDDAGMARMALADLAENHRELVELLEPTVAQEMAVGAIRRGRRLGLSDARDLTGFAAVCFIVAPNFAEHPRIRRAFEQEMMSGGPVLERVLARCEADLEAAGEAYDADAWFRD